MKKKIVGLFLVLLLVATFLLMAAPVAAQTLMAVPVAAQTDEVAALVPSVALPTVSLIAMAFAVLAVVAGCTWGLSVLRRKTRSPPVALSAKALGGNLEQSSCQDWRAKKNDALALFDRIAGRTVVNVSTMTTA